MALSLSHLYTETVMGDIDTKPEETVADERNLEHQFSSVDGKYKTEDESGSPDACRGSVGRYARRRSTAAALAIERLVRTRERIWTTAISTLIASLPMLLMGFTLGFPSVSVLQLRESPGNRRFNAIEIDLFVASAHVTFSQH